MPWPTRDQHLRVDYDVFRHRRRGRLAQELNREVLVQDGSASQHVEVDARAASLRVVLHDHAEAHAVVAAVRSPDTEVLGRQAERTGDQRDGVLVVVPNEINWPTCGPLLAV